MTVVNTKNGMSMTMWQSSYEDGVPESALVIAAYYGDTIGVRQGETEILVNVASANEFIKNIKSAVKASKEL